MRVHTEQLWRIWAAFCCSVTNWADYGAQNAVIFHVKLKALARSLSKRDNFSKPSVTAANVKAFMASLDPEPNSKLLPFVGERTAVTSSELVRALQRNGYSDENARQLIRRHSNANGIWRSEGMKLARGERLFARSSFVSQSAFLTAVGAKLAQTSRQGLARCLSVLGRMHVLNKIEVLRLLAVGSGTR